MIPEEADITIVYAARYRGLYSASMHRHVLFQLYLLCSDRLEFLENGQIVPYDFKRHVILVRPDTDHCLRINENIDSDWLAPGINCALDCKFSVSEPELCDRLMQLPVLIDVGDTSPLSALASLMLRSLENGSELSMSAAYSAFRSILEILLNYGGIAESGTKTLEVGSEPYFFSSNHRQINDTEGINTVKRYIDTHCHDRITLDELVRISHLNRSKLCSLFGKAYGMPPIEYVQKKRLDEAALLLRETAVEIGELADRVGFSSVSYFCRVFRKHFGMSPLEYRKKYTNQKLH